MGDLFGWEIEKIMKIMKKMSKPMQRIGVRKL